VASIKKATLLKSEPPFPSLGAHSRYYFSFTELHSWYS